MSYFLQGLIWGLAYLAPIGMQNLFVINSAIANNKAQSLFIALVVSFFDITLACACFFGIGVIIASSEMIKNVVLLVGSIIVIYIAIGLLRNNKQSYQTSSDGFNAKAAIITACVVTWFNPQAIIDGTMMLGAFSATLSRVNGYIFITGVCVASLLWFFSLSIIIGCLKEKFNFKVLQIINKICGIIILLYGLKLLYSFIKTMF